MVFETNFKIIHISILQIFVYILERVKKVLFEFEQEYKFETILYKILKGVVMKLTKEEKEKLMELMLIVEAKDFEIKKLKEEILEVNEEIEKLKKELEEDE